MVCTDFAVKTFPETWSAAVEANGTYQFDPMHFPFPLTPLTATTIGPAFAQGITRALREQNTPVQQFHVIHRNHYRFEWMEPKTPASDIEAQAMGKAAEATMKFEIGRLFERWHSEHLPAITNNIGRLRAMNVAEATPAHLRALLDEADAIHEDLWAIHFRIVAPMILAMQLHDEFFADLFGGEADAHVILTGEVSESLRAGFGISDLAALARDLGLAELVLETPESQVLQVLQASEAGQAFLTKFHAYLEYFGLRQDLFEYATPTWQENPLITLASVRSYLATGRDARAEHQEAVSKAEAALANARQQVSAYPEAVREQFEALVQCGRHANFLQEEHNFHIDQRAIASFRLFYLTVGKRLVDAGILDQPGDVFLLTIEEVHRAIDEVDFQGAQTRYRAIVERVTHELDQARQMTPPPFIGAPPSGPPPAGDPMGRAMVRFFGGPPQESSDHNGLNGNAGSRGSASGVARVARTLDEARHLQPGEILVAITTMPPWTPLFGIAAAVVTETGGPLSHCAIVAREYGIPAVVGAHGATTAIRTGQRITVNGTAGVVTLVD